MSNMPNQSFPSPASITLYLASDHAGFPLKETLVAFARAQGWTVHDLGPNGHTAVDYPDYAKMVSAALQKDPQALGVLLCGTGIGMCMAANRHPWIRAAVCNENLKVTKLARAHNHANVICLGARLVGPRYAKKALETFINTAPEGGRHEVRVEKLFFPIDKPSGLC